MFLFFVNRTCRIGQLKTVEVVYFVMAETVESKIYQLLTEAREASGQCALVQHASTSTSTSTSTSSSNVNGSSISGTGSSSSDNSSVGNDTVNLSSVVSSTDGGTSSGSTSNNSTNSKKKKYKTCCKGNNYDMDGIETDILLQYIDQMFQLSFMGFNDRVANIRALQATEDGNVHAAVEILLRGNSSESVVSGSSSSAAQHVELNQTAQGRQIKRVTKRSWEETTE